jgi:ubiquinone/menaquinone biosynthesis C-methylase UbiE
MALRLLFVCGFRSTLLDYSRETLRIVENNIVTAKEIQPAIKVRVVQGDMFNLPLLSRSYDLVFNEGALEHFATSRERIQCIREMLRVTKPGGHVMIMIPNNCHPLVPYWVKHDFPWLCESNPIREYLISPGMLEEEMKAAGCASVYVDGYEVYDSVQKWPRSQVRAFLARGLKCLLPDPSYKYRIKYGTYLFAIGQNRR